MTKRLRKALQAAGNEKDVENAYRAEITTLRPASITSPHGTDGVAQWPLDATTVRTLLEFKYDQQLKDRVQACGTLGQCLLYLKRFEEAGEPLPNCILVGDKNECFVLSTAAVRDFLDLEIDWKVAPSKGSPELVEALVKGVNILPFVYDVDGRFDFNEVLDKIDTLARGKRKTVRATPANLPTIFYYWRDNVFRDKRLEPQQEVDVFLRCLFQPSEVYLHPKKKGVLVVPGYDQGVRVNQDQYNSFFDHFRQGYKPSEIRRFLAMKDRLVQDEYRRQKGEFYTPEAVVAVAHQYMSRVLGEDWKERYLVWDPCCGTANLTRDYQFRDLILSTLEETDVRLVREHRYNPGAVICQMDFLNDPVPPEIDAALRRAREAGKGIVFLMNPPFVDRSKGQGVKGAKAPGTVSTLIGQRLKFGRARTQLFVQFLFGCLFVAKEYGFSDIAIGSFSRAKLFASPSLGKVVDELGKDLPFRAGFVAPSDLFSGCKAPWPVAFSVWRSNS